MCDKPIVTIIGAGRSGRGMLGEMFYQEKNYSIVFAAAVLSENCCFPQLKRYVLLVKRLSGVSIAAANVANTNRKIDSILYLCL